MPISELSRLPVRAPWMNGDGPDADVVLSSRIRLGRNLAGRTYPHASSDVVRFETLEYIESVIRDELFPDPLGAETLEVDPAALSDDERRFLAARSLADGDLPARLLIGPEEELVLHIDGTDHLRLSVTQSGLSLDSALERARRIDVSLENRLQYAVSMDWGYLSSRITDLGTAMRASVLVHVPALAELGRLCSMSRSMASSGYELVPYHEDESFPKVSDPDEAVADELAGKEEPTPCLCLLRNTRTLGSNEEVIAAKLSDYTGRLVNYERAAREELVRERETGIAEDANRALGILRFARSLTAPEARVLVGQLRLGVVAGLVDEVQLSAVTSLLLIGQDSQAARWTPDADKGDIDTVRARIFRDVLLEV